MYVDSTLDTLDAHVIWIIISCKIFVTHHFASSEKKIIPEKIICLVSKLSNLLVLPEMILFISIILL